MEFLIIRYTIKVLSVFDAHLALERLKKMKTLEQADGGGKTIQKKSAEYIQNKLIFITNSKKVKQHESHKFSLMASQ